MKSLKTDSRHKITRAHRLVFAVALLAVAALGAGCGQQAYQEGEEDDAGSFNDPGNGGNNGGSSLPNWTPTIVTTNTNEEPSQSFPFRIKGNGTAVREDHGEMTVSTDKTLIIGARAGTGGTLSGFTVGFNCQQFSITAGSVTKTAFVKKAQYNDLLLPLLHYDPCDGAVVNWKGDFSAGLGVGHGPITITVKSMYYDNCRLFYDYSSQRYRTDLGGCDKSALYSTHIIDAMIEVFTD